MVRPLACARARARARCIRHMRADGRAGIRRKCARACFAFTLRFGIRVKGQGVLRIPMTSPRLCSARLNNLLMGNGSSVRTSAGTEQVVTPSISRPARSLVFPSFFQVTPSLLPPSLPPTHPNFPLATNEDTTMCCEVLFYFLRERSISS